MQERQQIVRKAAKKSTSKVVNSMERLRIECGRTFSVQDRSCDRSGYCTQARLYIIIAACFTSLILSIVCLCICSLSRWFLHYLFHASLGDDPHSLRWRPSPTRHWCCNVKFVVVVNALCEVFRVATLFMILRQARSCTSKIPGDETSVQTSKMLVR